MKLTTHQRNAALTILLPTGYASPEMTDAELAAGFKLWWNDCGEEFMATISDLVVDFMGRWRDAVLARDKRAL